MSEPDGNGKTYVTNRDLAQKLSSLRWELRFYVLAALIASKVIPVDVANAVTGFLGFH